MKLAELQKKIADVLGVSVSQKELSFEIFIDKISEILLENITLKVPRVGYFQLKEISAKNGIHPLIFAPLSEDFSRESRNLYLTIEVSPRIKNTPEFDSNIFSIGVGKPLLPLSFDELPDTETSYAMLKKSIEERVKEILMESDQIPHFNIWDDYYKSPEEYEEELVDETKSQLIELTSDLQFKEEIITDRIPDNISDNYNVPSSELDQISQFDDSNLLDEENKQKENIESYDQLLMPSKEELESNLGDVLFPTEEELGSDSGDILFSQKEESGSDSGDVLFHPEEESEHDARNVLSTPEENTDLGNTIEISSHEEDYSALKNLELVELSDDTITISDLLDDTIPSGKNRKNETEEIEREESVIPIEEVLPRMLVDDKIEISTDFTHNQKKSLFEELHDLSSEVKSLEENEEDIFETTQSDEEEKIEWNWGDELREEFGIPAVEREDAQYEMIKNLDAEKKDSFELADDFLDKEMTTQDLFARLERTIERELDYVEEPKQKLTNQDSKPTEEDDGLKKIIMEFSGPPAKYEFVEDRPAVKEKRMAISLVDEESIVIKKDLSETDKESVVIKKDLSVTDEEIIAQSKDSYFGKMFLIIFGAFIVVAAVAVFIIINGNNTHQVTDGSKSIEQQTNSNSENIGAPTQSDPQSKDTSTLPFDDLTDFPRTATAPVPIKDATDRQIMETIKNETAKLQSPKKEEKEPAKKSVAKETNTKPTNRTLDKTVVTDTKVSNRIFFDGKSYYLQVSSWSNRIRAEEEVNRLRALGFNTFIVEANLPQKGGIWYRVRVGPFKAEKETEEFMKKNNL